jgi:type I restriction enzyme S subunit
MEKGKQTYKLPEGWIWTTIGEIAVLSSGGTPSRGNSGFFKGDIPWVKSGELDYNIITKTEEKIS